MTYWTKEAVKTLIMTNDKALIRALKSLFQFQTDQEQVVGDALESNGVGFNKPDSHTAKQFIRLINSGYTLKTHELIQLRYMMQRYIKQLTKIANLNEMMTHSGENHG